MNDKNAQLQKQLENVIREANGEINLLSSKVSELERDLELERRKVHDLQDATRERDKEYQKLKTQHDKIKRKALLTPNPIGREHLGFEGPVHPPDRHAPEGQHPKVRTFGTNMGNAVDLEAVVGGMEANGIQRTPIVNRTMSGTFGQQHGSAWPQNPPGPALARSKPQRQPFGQADRSFRLMSDRSENASEVENMLLLNPDRLSSRTSSNQGGWSAVPQKTRPSQRVFAPQTNQRSSGGFRPAGGVR